MSIRHRVLLLAAFCLVAKPAFAEGEEPPYRLGFIVSLSGQLAEFGEAIRNGVTLAREEDPELGKRFEPLFEDSRYESKTAVTNFEKLRSADRVSAVYVFGGPMSDTLAPLAERAAVPMFSTEYDVRYTAGRKYVFRFANNAEDYARALIESLRKHKRRKFAIVKVENQYHNTLSDAFLHALQEGEQGSVMANFLPGEKDFRPVFPKLKAAAPDALGVYLSPGMQHAFFKELQSAGLKLPTFGTDTFESRTENSGVEDVVEGALFANSVVEESFERRYRTRFKGSAQLVHAALAYEFVKLFGSLTAKDTAPATAGMLASRFAIQGGRPSVCGEYFYRNSPATGQYFSFPVAVREVRRGESIIVERRPAP